MDLLYVSLIRSGSGFKSTITTLSGTKDSKSLTVFEGSDDSFTMHIPNISTFFWKLFSRGEIGLGESFVEGGWSVTRGDVGEMLTTLAPKNIKSTFDKVKAFLPTEWVRGIKFTFSNHNAEQAKDLIKVAYDVDDSMFEAMLDPSMTYTSARWLTGDESLEEAQAIKRNLMIQKASLPANANVLDIGCGWAGLVNHVADLYHDVTCTGVTNSPSMANIAMGRTASRRKQVGIQECDYRQIDLAQGSLDAIFSVEMIEAIGVEQFGEFASVCAKLLKPGGRAVIQVITVPAWSNPAGRSKNAFNNTFVQTYIFPGGQIPNVEHVQEAMAPYFDNVHTESFGHDYARTLREWRANLEAKKSTLKTDNKTLKAYEYYLSWCEAGFRSELLNVQQLVFRRK